MKVLIWKNYYHLHINKENNHTQENEELMNKQTENIYISTTSITENLLFQEDDTII